MEVSKGIVVKFEGLKLIAEADLGVIFLNEIEAKINSGVIDPVPHTDLDKEVLLKAIAALKAMSV